MWNLSALSIPDDVAAEKAYTLSNEIPAMELIPAPNGETRLGPVSRIPEGAELEACGQGFNDRTLKVRCQGKFYFVFLQDLELQRKPAAKCAYN